MLPNTVIIPLITTMECAFSTVKVNCIAKTYQENAAVQVLEFLNLSKTVSN